MSPIGEEGKDFFFQHATSSDATPLWYGPLYHDKVPNKEEFFEDWKSYYFQDIKNRKGRCFHILKEGQRLGQINYNEINDEGVELDILIYNKKDWNQGYGTSAIKLMSAFLEEKFHVTRIWIDVHPENIRAIQAYKKAGFTEGKIRTNKAIQLIKN